MPPSEDGMVLVRDKIESAQSVPNWWRLAFYSGMSGAAFAIFTFVLLWVSSAWGFKVAINGPFERISIAVVGAMATAGISLGIRLYYSRALFRINILLVGISLLSAVVFLMFLSDQPPMGRGIGLLILLLGGQICLTLLGICLAISTVASAVIVWCRHSDEPKCRTRTVFRWWI